MGEGTEFQDRETSCGPAGQNCRLSPTELVRLKVDLILTNGTPATLAAKAAPKTIPIVFVLGADPVAAGLVASFARPGGNITGFAVVPRQAPGSSQGGGATSSRVAFPVSPEGPSVGSPFSVISQGGWRTEVALPDGHTRPEPAPTAGCPWAGGAGRRRWARRLETWPARSARAAGTRPT
jgi:hypothetical protein